MVCLAVEPFVSTKAKIVTNTDKDDWELTKDGSYMYNMNTIKGLRKNQEPLILTVNRLIIFIISWQDRKMF